MKSHQIFFFLLLVFLPTQLSYHFWPDWAHVLGRRVDYLAPTIYFTDILVGLTLISFRIPRTWNRTVFLVILFAAANIFVAASPFVAAYKWLKVFEFAWLAWYVAHTRPKLSFIANAFCVAVIYSSLLAIAQFALQHSVGGPLWLVGERTFHAATPGIARMVIQGKEMLRPYATFPHPNVLGGFLAVALPILIMVRKKKFRLPILLGGIALVLTMSRAAIVVGTLGIAVVVHKKFRFPLLLVSFALAVLFFIPLSSVDESFAVRGELQEAAVQLWKTAPLVGVGLGNFLVRLPAVLPSRQIYFLQPVHNIYLLLLSEVGIVGVALLAFVMRKWLRAMCHVLCVMILLLGFVDHYPLTLQQGQLLFAVLLGVSVSGTIPSWFSSSATSGRVLPTTRRRSFSPKDSPQGRRSR